MLTKSTVTKFLSGVVATLGLITVCDMRPLFAVMRWLAGKSPGFTEYRHASLGGTHLRITGTLQIDSLPLRSTQATSAPGFTSSSPVLGGRRLTVVDQSGEQSGRR